MNALPFFLPVIIAAICWAIMATYRATIDSIRQDGGYERHLGAFMRERMRDGLPYLAAVQELRVRESLAALRRKASAAVMANPTEWLDVIDRCKREEAEELAKESKELAKTFLDVLDGLSYAEILYSDATRTVDSLAIAPATRPTIDQRAAVKPI